MKKSNKSTKMKVFHESFSDRLEAFADTDFYSIPANVAVLTEIGKPIYLR